MTASQYNRRRPSLHPSQLLDTVLPREVYAANGWAPVEVAVSLEVVDVDGESSAASPGAAAGRRRGKAATPDAAKARAGDVQTGPIRIAPMELLTDVVTDCESDHPLLLQLLLLPGFGDGLPVPGVSCRGRPGSAGHAPALTSLTSILE